MAATQRQIKRMRVAIYILAAVAAALAIYLYVEQLPPPAHKYDAFAKCIANTSTTFYGAFWCPHCAEQKNKFGTGAQYLPYVECSTPDGSAQNETCKAKGIAEYPTWYFPDGSTSTGVTSLNIISQKTGCALPTSTTPA